MTSQPLICHPSRACAHVRSLDAHIERRRGLVLALRYVLTGNVDRLRIPVQTSPARVDYLWRHTCFEAFLCKPDAVAYCELNYSPSREWAAYLFEGYRAGMTPARLASDPTIAVARTADTLEVAAHVDLSQQRGELGTGGLQVALSAVIEDVEGQITYWALRHPPGKADFHHADGFVLRLD